VPARVVLDANVLFPASLRDLLLRCAEYDLYELHSSRQIWQEVLRNLRSAGHLSEEQVQRLDHAIQAFFLRRDAFVTGYEPLIPQLRHHPNDRHVLAVAVHVRAQFILTFNVRDFPTLRN
jgi:predicted nucleic acid-binding protein